MTDFQAELLNALLDKYEKGTNPKVFCNSREALFSDYFCKKSYIYRPQIEKDVSELESYNYISVFFSNDGELKSISLNLEKVEFVYNVLDRKSKKNIDDECLSYIETCLCSDMGSVTKVFLKTMKDLIENEKRHKFWFDQVEDLREMSEMANAIEQHTGNELLRNFSKRLFEDSKAVERNSSIILKIFNIFGDFEYTDFDSLLSFYGISRNPGFVYIRGPINLTVNNLKIDVKQFGYTFCLPDLSLDCVTVDKVYGKNIVTVENLTTFNTINDENSIFVYLGGFGSSSTMKFLKMLYENAEKCQWYHFSDIDVGGFRIFNNLKIKTGINFRPLLMNRIELQKYEAQCQSLSEFDIKNLARMKTEPEYLIFEDTIDYMLEHNIKLEQESVRFSIEVPSNTTIFDFCSQNHSVTLQSYATWRHDYVYIDCTVDVSFSFKVSDFELFKKQFKEEITESTPEKILNRIKKRFQDYLDEDFYDYVTADDYYEPVVEDYQWDRDVDLEHFGEKLGLKMENIVIQAVDSGYMSD